MRTIILLLLCTSVWGLEITEVMFDPDGPDSGHEWVEITNDGAAVNLSMYRFFENNVHHQMSVWQGFEILGNGSAIIADEADKFLSDYPSFSGTVLDSSWSSLSNSGELIGISKDGEIVHQIEYDSTWQTDTPGYIDMPSVPEFSLAGLIAILSFAFLAYRR